MQVFTGICGLQTISLRTDEIYAVVQGLVHAPKMRDYFLTKVGAKTSLTIMNSSNEKKKQPKTIQLSELVLVFGGVVRKLWIPHKLKHHMSPHRLVHEIHKKHNKTSQRRSNHS